MFYHFELKPYSKGIKRSLKKEGKLFLWDYAEAPERGHRFENLVVQHILKACNFWTDAGFGQFNVMYLRNAEGEEIDMLVVRDGKPWLPIEVKVSEITPSSSWKVFLPNIPCSFGIQVVQSPDRHYAEHLVGNKKLLVMDATRFSLL